MELSQDRQYGYFSSPYHQVGKFLMARKICKKLNHV